jgi:hypothetical protein
MAAQAIAPFGFLLSILTDNQKVDGAFCETFSDNLAAHNFLKNRSHNLLCTENIPQ